MAADARRTAGSADPSAATRVRSMGGDREPARATGAAAAAARGPRTGPTHAPTLSAAHLPSLRPPPGSVSPLDHSHLTLALDGEYVGSNATPRLPVSEKRALEDKRPPFPAPDPAPGHRRVGVHLVLALTLIVIAGAFMGTLVCSSAPCPGHVLRRMRHAYEHHAHSPAQAVAMASHKAKTPKKTNVIFMISDGYGPASETFTRAFVQSLHAQSNDASAPEHQIPPQLTLDKFLVGQHRSMSTDSLITDSAAGATAFASAVKSYNGAIGVTANMSGPGGTSPVATLFEAAKVQRGLLTGVVVTSRLTDATPACFLSHADDRSMEPLIAEHLVRGSLNGISTRPGKTQETSSKAYPRTVDLAIGGGACAFLPSKHPLSCRRDEVDLLAEASKGEWNVAAPRLEADMFAPQATGSGAHGSNDYVAIPHDDTRSAVTPLPSVKEMLEAKAQSGTALPFLGLLAPYNTPYEVDRLQLLSSYRGTKDEARARYPSLKDLSLGAIKALHADQSNKNGFMLMIEGSQIDLCAHENDPACHAFEAAAYQRAIAAVAQWVDAHNNDDEETILISTSDHETGGLTLGRQLTQTYPNYAYYPERLIHAKASAAALSRKLVAHVIELTENGNEPLKAELEDWVRTNILGRAGAGFGPKAGGPVRHEEVAAVLSCLASMDNVALQSDAYAMVPPINTHDTCRRIIADLVSRRVEVGWSTQGHTGVDINVYAHGAPVLAGLQGNMDNTYPAQFIADTLKLDLAAITRQLQASYH